MIDCYVVKYKSVDYERTYSDSSTNLIKIIAFDEVYFPPLHCFTSLTDFLECIHFPSLKIISYNECISILKKFQKNLEINRLILERNSIQNKINDLNAKIEELKKING